MCKRIHMIKVCENGSLVPAWPLSGPMNACLLLFCRSRHWQSLTRQWLSHQRKEPAADRANHIKRGCQGALLVNRGNKHLLILTYSPAADTHRCAPSQCLHWEKMYCLDLIPLSAPSSRPSSSACVNLEPSDTQRAAQVFKNALWMHDKEEVDTAGGQKVHILRMDTYSYTFSLGRVTLELICMRFKLQKEGQTFLMAYDKYCSDENPSAGLRRHHQLQITLMEICILILFFFTQWKLILATEVCAKCCNMTDFIIIITCVGFLISLNVFKKHYQFTFLYYIFICVLNFLISADISKISTQKCIWYTRHFDYVSYIFFKRV